MQYDNKDLNLCILSGVIINPPELSMQGSTHILSLTLQQYPTNTLIPCIALGNFALKLHASLQKKDKVLIHAIFTPKHIDNKTVFRFLISSCTITEKPVSPFPLSFTADNNTQDLLHYLDNGSTL